MASSVRRVTGNPEIRYYTCASATPAFAKGDLVKTDSSGLLVIATAGSILGIAMKNAPASTTTPVPVDILDGTGEFLIKSHTTTAETEINNIYDCVFTTTAVTTTTDSSHDVCVVDTFGTLESGGYYIVKFIASSLQGIGG